MPETTPAAARLLDSGHRATWISAGILVLSALAWALTIGVVRAMPMPAQQPSAVDGVVFLGAWLLMMAAMMLPSALPMFRLYGRMSGSRPGAFVAGYLVLWWAAGLIAYVGYAGVHGGLLSMAEMSGAARPAAIGLIVVAALYQASPLKSACLRHCRSPLAFVVNHWRSGLGGAVRMGLGHGAWCLGCCAGLMALLFAVGVMSIGWMVLLALIILAEKALPGGVWIARAGAGAMVGLALIFAVSPEAFALLVAQTSM